MNIRKMKEEYYKYFTEDEALEAVRKDGDNLRYIKNQTEINGRYQ